MVIKQPHQAAPERLYRGLYAGISEVAYLAGVSKQYASAHLAPKMLRKPEGFLNPLQRTRPYWFLRDVQADLAGRLRQDYIPGDIEEWEYDYQGAIIGVTQVAQMADISSGNVHSFADYWGDLFYADALLMGTLWREDDVKTALENHEYPRKNT